MIRTELPKSYNPAAAEDEIRAKWEAARAFHAEPDGSPSRNQATSGESRGPYCILIPPPNVTAALHLGHALNNTLQDVLIRAHRMMGFNTLWMPGTDHAGIATQTVVEKRLLQNEGKRRTDYERDEFIAKVQAWKDEYEATILEQLKAMGASCDFERTRFTMDDMCAKAVREAFFRLFRDGLIYRGKRLVNWDPVTQTALADDEVEMREVQGAMHYLRYPLVRPPRNPDDPLDCEEVTWSELAARGYPNAEAQPEDDNAWLTVATTRPETYLGDTAVAVNPKDPRAPSLRGLMIQLPLVGRVIPVIEDDFVVMPDTSSSEIKAQIATGFLKVTPAHDPNDYEIGQRHGLEKINVMAPDATISDKHGWQPDDVRDARIFLGLSREAARKKVIDEFKARGLLEAVKPYTHSVGHSYRSHVPIEPYLSDQWYVKVTDDRLKGEALRAMANEQFEGEKPARQHDAHAGDGELQFFPARYAKTFQQWHENLRDWCISRQLWWGHRIPVWSAPITEESQEAIGEIAGEPGVSLMGCTLHVERTEKSVSTHYDWDEEWLENAERYFVCVNGNKRLEDYLESEGFEQDPDVLDTWFSSGLWPLSTMGWPTPEDYADTNGLLESFNPSSVLCTAREIITLWVSRMVMFNRYFRRGTLPFRHVYIHPMIQDGHGQKMSKSLGNGVDPRDIIRSHGADALRFTLAKLATATQDVRLPVDMMCPHEGCGETFEPKEITTSGGHRVAAPEQTCPKCGRKMISGYGYATGVATPTDAIPLAFNVSRKFDEGRNFANKLWNATRFALSNLNGTDAKAQGLQSLGPEALPLVDRWMISRLHRALHTVEDALDQYQYNVYADAMYDLVWREFCDWYLEAVKPTVRENPAQQQVLRTMLSAILRMLHPVMPFVTEALWPHVQEAGEAGLPGIELPSSELLCLAPWPDIACSVHDKDAESTFARVQALVEAIRNIRGERNIPPKRKLTLHVPPALRDLISTAEGTIETLAGLSTVEDLTDRPDAAAPLTFEGHELLISDLFGSEASGGGPDLEAERARLTKMIEEKRKAITGYQNRLANENYVKKAPAKLVEETKDQLAQAEADLAAAERALQSIAG